MWKITSVESPVWWSRGSRDSNAIADCGYKRIGKLVKVKKQQRYDILRYRTNESVGTPLDHLSVNPWGWLELPLRFFFPGAIKR